MTPHNFNHSHAAPDASGTGQSAMTCEEFQEKIPELFSSGNQGFSGDPALMGHLNICANCSALLRDLQYIADQARMLLEPVEEEPSPEVWSNIQSRLREASDSPSSSPRNR